MRSAMKEYPNILILNNQSIYKNNATGITLRSILGAWPEENLYEMQMDKEFASQNKDGKKRSSYIIDSVPLYNVMRSVHKLLSRRKECKKSSQSNKEDGIRNVSVGMRSSLNSIIDGSPVLIRIDWNKYLKGFVPDVIYTCGASVAVMKIALKAARKYHVPIVLHFMDDWVHYLQNEQGLVQHMHKKKLCKWLKKCYAKSVINFAISPYMAKEYEEETGIPHIALMNAVSVDKFVNEPLNHKLPCIFTYAGGLHLERWKALKEIEEILWDFNQKGYQFRLRIYTDLKNNYQIKYFNSAITEIYEAVPHEEMYRIMKEADVLIHAETQNPALMGFFRYSISTKIPEYMAANRPILFYGPKEMRLLQHLKEHEMAFVASDKEELRYCIKELSEDKRKVEKIRNNADGYVVENQEITKVQETFYLTMCKITNYKSEGKEKICV